MVDLETYWLIITSREAFSKLPRKRGEYKVQAITPCTTTSSQHSRSDTEIIQVPATPVNASSKQSAACGLFPTIVIIMKTTFITSFLMAVASLVASAPAPKSLDARGSGAPERFNPDVMVQIHESHPDHQYGDTDWGLVARENGKDNVYTLVSIHVPHHAHGRDCRYVFNDPHDLGGTMSVQLFTVIGEVPYDATFNKRPSRDRHVATFKATWDDAEFTFYGGDRFPCPAGQTVHFELVPTGDYDRVEWYDPYGFAIETWV
ncbi:hypothetical protein BDZ91DRAFT_739039 [Kalaharituber pfeilii]|nr:hypothetical protein BDZ91DRAFT_739039 [Kalaharituber pfeilii]